MLQLAIVVLGENRTDETFFRPTCELLLDIGHAGFKIQRLVRSLDGSPSDSAVVSLLKIQPLGVIVIEGRLPEREQRLGEVFVTPNVGVKNGRLDRWRIGLGYFSEGFGKTDQRAIARIQPIF